MLGVNEVGNTIHRSGPVKRDHRHHVLDTGWLELFDVLGHLRALELEDTRRLTACQQVERFFAFRVLLIIIWHHIKWYFFQHHILITRLFDIFERVIQDGQVR